MCRYIHSIIKDDEGRLLMQSLPNDSWQTLGGEVDHGESPKEAFMRIASEDLGLMLNDIKLVDVIKDADRQIHVFSACINENVIHEYVEHSRRFALLGNKDINNVNLNEHTRFVLDRERGLLKGLLK